MKLFRLVCLRTLYNNESRLVLHMQIIYYAVCRKIDMSSKIVATPGVDNYVSHLVVNQQFERSLCHSGDINITVTNRNLDQCQFC